MYEWLHDYQELIQKIEYLEYKIEREKRELKRWERGDLVKVKLHPESIAANLEERIKVMEYELAHYMNDQYETRKLIGTFKGLENKILFGKYVEGFSLEEIAAQLNYSYSHISKKHAEIIRTVKFVSNYFAVYE